jgi:hypothetical protein
MPAFITNLTPSMSVLITAALMIVIGVITQQNLIDSAFADRVITFLLGGGSGVALAGGFSKPGGV